MNDFKGKYLRSIGIGSPLNEVAAALFSLEKDLNGSDSSYCSKYAPGIIFEIQDDLDEDLHISSGRIECICITKA